MQVYYKLYDIFKNLTITRDMTDSGFNVPEIDELVETIRSTHPKHDTPEYELRWLIIGHMQYIKYCCKRMIVCDECNDVRLMLDEMMKDMEKYFNIVSSTKDESQQTIC